MSRCPSTRCCARTGYSRPPRRARRRRPSRPRRQAVTVRLSPVLAGLATYPFVRLAEARARVAARGVEILDFGMGEPREETPAFIRDALVAALRPLSTYPSA